jgi:hypothetical protein
LSKDGDETMVSELTNKKLHQDISKALSGLDLCIGKDDKQFFIKFPAEHQELKKAVVDFQTLITVADFHSINVTPFCLPEVHACTGGSYWLVGVRADAIGGDTMASRIDKLRGMRWLDLMASVGSSGLAVNIFAGDVVAIPAGMVVLTIADEKDGCEVIRWSVLTGMLQSYSYLEATDYSTVKTLLEATNKSRVDEAAKSASSNAAV